MRRGIVDRSIEVMEGIEVDFLVSEPQINWACSDMARPGQINSKLYLRNILKRQIWSSFLCKLNPINRDPMKSLSFAYLSLL